MRLRNALLLVIISLNLFAVTKTWQGTSSSMSTGSNWSPAVAPMPGDDLVFPKSPTVSSITNDIVGTLNVGSMSFHDTYTLSGNSFATAASGGVSISLGTLTFNQPNQFSGVISVGTVATPATLTAGAAGAIGNASFQPFVTLLGTSTLNLNGNDNTLLFLSGNLGSSVTLGSGTLTVIGSSTDLPFYGNVSGAGNIAVPSGTLPLMGTNTYSGTTTIQGGGSLNTLNSTGSTSMISFPSGAGSLVFGGSGSFNTPIDIAGTAQISVNDHNVTLSGELSGPGTLQKLGRGTLTLTGTNTNLTGPLIIKGGILNVTTASLGNFTSILFDTFGGAIQIAENMAIPQPITLSNFGGFDTNGFNLTISGPISGSHPFTKSGAGTLTLTNSVSNYTGKTVIQEGTLNVTPTTFPTSSTQLVFDSPGTGILQIADNFPSFTSSIVLFDNGTIDTNSQNMTISGVIAGLTGNTFNKNGMGTLILMGENVYQAATSVNAGTLQAGIASMTTYGPFGLSSPVTVASGATLDFQNFETTVGSLDNLGTVFSSNTVDASSFTQANSGTLELNFPTNQAVPVGNISVTGAINLDGMLDVTNTGGFTFTQGNEIILLQSSGSGKQLTGTFSSATLPFGKLKYDYAQNQVILGLGGCDGIWGSASNGDWGLVGNWSSSCVPGIGGNSQDSATFNDVAAGAVTVTLADSGTSTALPVILHDITFNASSTVFTIDQFDNTSVITLDAPSGSSSPTIHITDGTPTINTPILLNTASVFSLSTGTLTLGSNTTITSANNDGLQIIEGQNNGTLTNNGSITPASLAVNGSTLNNNATIQTTGSIIIEDLAGLTNPIMVTNASTFTAGTTFSIGGDSTVTNSATMASEGNFTINNGMVTNQSGGQLNAGSSSTFSVTGGTLTNAQGGILGTADSNLSVSGGALNSADQILANNYTQTSGGTLGLNFPTTSASPVGKISAAAAISLSGTLNVTNTGGFSPTPGTEIVLLESSGSGKQLSGSFTTTTLPFGKLKYDYSQNQVILGVGGCDGTWAATTNGNWGTVGNWSSGCVPGINGNAQDSSTFNDVAAGAITVTLANDSGNAALPVILHEIAFNSANTTYTIEQFDNTSIIHLDEPNASSSPSIILTAGTATIDTPIILNTDSVLSVSSGTLIFGPNTTIAGSNDLQISEGHTSGTITNNGAITPASFTIEGNTFNNMGSVQTTGSIVIEDLPGVDNPIVINNFSTFIAGTNLSISGNAMISNQSGAQMNAGSGSLLSVAGGTVTNSQGATFGTSDADLTISGGIVNNSGITKAKTYTQSSPATLQLNLLNSSSFGQVLVSDQASLGGNLIINASSDPSIVSGQSFDLITTQNGVSNTFSNISFQGFPGSTIPDLIYLPNTVQLKTSPSVPGHFSGNQSHISFGLVRQHSSYVRRKCFQFRDRLPNGSAPANQNTISQINLTHPEVKGIMVSLKEPTSMNTAQEKDTTPILEPLPTRANHTRDGKVYIGPVASFGEIDSKKDQIGSTYTSAGGLIGADYLFREIEKFPCDIGVGGTVQYRRLCGNGKNNSGDYQSHILHGSLYSSFIPQALQALSIETVVGYTHIWDYLNRTAGFDKNSKARSNTDQNLFDTLLGLEYTLTLPKQFSFTPYLYLQYIYNHVDGFKESGAKIYNLKVKSQSINSLNTQLGARTCYNLIRKSYTLTFELDVEWIREYLNNDRSVGFIPFLITNQPTNITAFAPSRNSILLATDLLLKFPNGWQAEAGCTFQYNSLFYDNFFYLGVGKRF